MSNIFLIAKLDITESFRSRWFLLYMLVFTGLVITFIFSGITDSRVLGFSGLTRLLLLFIQICVIIVPIFILVSTVRSINADRDTNLLEYILSFPISLAEYYFGKALGRIFVIFTPLVFALLLTLVTGVAKDIEIPWQILGFYTALLFSLSIVFLSFGFFISALIKNQEMGQGVAFLLWLVLLAFMDLVLIGFLMKSSVREDIIFFIALINPIEVFRVAAISLFDPNLAVIGVASNFILTNFSTMGFVLYSIFYPIVLGVILLTAGYFIFSSKDLV
ncbi:ABC transporter permease [Campylobacter sp. RM9344]|uniref:ABC transporter permease n=1 Tax=Campylobacter californiensis TaxID=1032243 RepID=A0AAW3ZSV8_9BACT|nr:MULTISPECIES: ABC transporter permease subunit [unclassified Campylobacter]MBE2983897.1 ABC transporter permease [Campylobacter sp. RM6883]MBE2986059.1 ABC transporter permease [Campylobacter sp. RM12919]MBE2987472.1 ABC transporter permease [Campylobacter sp. RM12920]MBE2994435.1 ABC transporter permease [Campylobacter sp. RM6913]MBE3028743.1 ABC transporter permease [Campylobacter sp. RM9344]